MLAVGKEGIDEETGGSRYTVLPGRYLATSQEPGACRADARVRSSRPPSRSLIVGLRQSATASTISHRKYAPKPMRSKSPKNGVGCPALASGTYEKPSAKNPTTSPRLTASKYGTSSLGLRHRTPL